MTKKIILAVLAVALVAFMSITVYKAWFEPKPSVEVEEEDEEKSTSEREQEEIELPPPPPPPPPQTCDVCNNTGQCPAKCDFGWIEWGITPCPVCNGTGYCYKCGGTSIILDNTNTTTSNPPRNDTIECGICHGNGKCTMCAGNGKRLIGDSFSGYSYVPCEYCHQSGQCEYCYGKGHIYR